VEWEEPLEDSQVVHLLEEMEEWMTWTEIIDEFIIE
jgi:hypothetical protein